MIHLASAVPIIQVNGLDWSDRCDDDDDDDDDDDSSTGISPVDTTCLIVTPCTDRMRTMVFW